MVGLKVVVQVHNRCTRMCMGINKVNEGMGGGQQGAPTKWSRPLGPLCMCVGPGWISTVGGCGECARWKVAAKVVGWLPALMKSIP